MCEKIFFPSCLNCGFEGKDQNLLPLHLQGELVGGKGLAEAHLAVPEEVRRTPLFRSIALEIGRRLIHRPFLFRPHAEILDAVPSHIYPVPDGHNGRPYLLRCAAIPFALNMSAPHFHQHAMHVMVHKHRTILPHGRFLDQDTVRWFARAHNVILLAYSFLHANRGIAHLQNTFQVGVILVFVRIDHRSRLRLFRKIVVIGCHRLLFILFHWSYHRFDELNFLVRQVVLLVKLLVRPRLAEVLEGDEQETIFCNVD